MDLWMGWRWENYSEFVIMVFQAFFHKDWQIYWADERICNIFLNGKYPERNRLHLLKIISLCRFCCWSYVIYTFSASETIFNELGTKILRLVKVLCQSWRVMIFLFLYLNVSQIAKIEYLSTSNTIDIGRVENG